jgi:hypothetical protein
MSLLRARAAPRKARRTQRPAIRPAGRPWRWIGRRVNRVGGSAGRRNSGEIGEKFISHVLGDAVDEARAKLGDLAADMRLYVVAQHRARRLGERNSCAALGEAGHVALALARDSPRAGQCRRVRLCLLNGAETGPIFVLTTAAKPLSLVFSGDSQPAMLDLSTSGSFRSAQTFGLSAGKLPPPVIVMAMTFPSCADSIDPPPVRGQRTNFW